MPCPTSSKLKLEQDDESAVSLGHEVEGESEVTDPGSATVFSPVKLACVINAKEFVRLKRMSLSSALTFGAGLVPSILSGGIR